MADDGEHRAGKCKAPETLKSMDTLKSGKKSRVESWCKSPVGRLMTDYINNLVKDGNKLPLLVTQWRDMPDVSIKNAWLEVKKKFDCPDYLDDWIRDKLHRRWKDHKVWVKKEGFYKYTTQEERLAHRPKDVVESQWGELLKYWQNPKTEARCAAYKANGSKRTAQQSTGGRPRAKYAAELAAKLKRAPTTKETYNAHKKRKKQMEGLENKPYSPKKMKMSAEASGYRGEVSENTPLRRSKRLNKPEHLPLSRSNSTSTSPVHLMQECVTEDGKGSMQDESDESIEGFGSAGEPVEAAKMTSFAEPVEAAKVASYPKCPTVESIPVSINPPKDISTSFSGRGNDEEFEFVGNFNVEMEYASPEGFGSVEEPVEVARMTSSASSGEPIGAVKATSSAGHVQAAGLTSTRVSGRESDEELEFVDNFQIPKKYTVLCKKTIKAESDECFEENFGSVVGKLVEAAKTTSSVKCPTVDSKLVSTSSAKEIAAPVVRSTSVSVRGSDEEFEFVDNFKIPKEYAVLYKKIFEKYGHMATKKVIKSNDALLVACVSGLLKIISTMETVRGVDLSEALLESWDGEIEDAENLGFDIKWLRDTFDGVKNRWKSSSGIHKEVQIHEKELDATQVKYASLLARKAKLDQEISEVIVEIREAETKISSEKKTIQEKLAAENNFLDEPILGKLLG